MALTLIQQVRLIVQDTEAGLYFLSDDEIQFFLDRNNQNVNKTSLECAKVILLQLSLRSGGESVDIFSLSRGDKAAEAYRLALQLFLRDPNLNPIYNSVNGYAGGISKKDIQANLDNVDNNFVDTPNSTLSFTNPDLFGVYQHV
jgi:hypothetical protein